MEGNPPGNHPAIMQTAHHGLSLLSAERAATQHGTKHFKLIVNMAKDSSEAKGTYLKLNQVADHFLTGVVTEYIGYVPVDDMIKKAVINRKAIMELFPDAVSSKKLNEIAKTLLDAPRQLDSDGNIKFFLQGYMDYKKS